jgi:hypothetical protein
MGHETRYVDMNSLQARAYREFCEALLDEKVDLFGPGNVHLTMLSMFAAGRGERIDASKVTVRSAGSAPIGSPAKLAAVHELLDNWDGRPTVVITISQQVLASLHHLVKRRKMVDRVAFAFGAHQPENQLRGLQAFSRGERPILLASPASIGVGTDLSRAETMVFLQRSWSPAENHWVESKLSPQCQIVTYVTSGTVEVHQHLGLEQLRQVVTGENIENFLYGRELKE